MASIPFDAKEMEIASRGFSFDPTVPGPAIFSFPMSEKEAYESLIMKKDPIWMPYGVETGFFCPQVIPDNKARGFVFEKNMIPPEEFGGKDMFGIEWVYVPVAGGSMEKPGVPHPLDDVNDWKEKIHFPDINAWDWDASGRENKDYLNNGKANFFWFLNGAGFERLISFMGFEEAAVALIDEDQEDALHELLSALTDLHIKMIDAACEVYGDGISGFCVHDDWGSQKAPFFSVAAGREFFVPEWQRLTSHIKSKGKIADLHSCGHIEAQIENIVDGGWQSWTPMPMNDTHKLYEDYGDKILIGVCCEPFDPAGSYEEQKAAGAKFASEFFKPGKPGAYSSMYSGLPMTDGFLAGIYETSRKV